MRELRERGSSSLLAVFGLASLLLGGAGCDGAGGTDAGAPPDSAGAAVVLGTGSASFEDLPEGSEIELIAGPQGGFHVLVSMRLVGFDREEIGVEYVVTPTGEGGPLSMPTVLVLDANRFVREGDALLRVGDFVVMQNDLRPEDLNGVEARIEATVRDRRGVTASDERTVTIVDEFDELGAG